MLAKLSAHVWNVTLLAAWITVAMLVIFAP